MSSSVHFDNKRNLDSMQKPTTRVTLTALAAEKQYSVTFTEQQKKCCLSFYYNGVNSYLFVNGIEIYKFRAKDSEINGAPSCLGNVFKDFQLIVAY